MRGLCKCDRCKSVVPSLDSFKAFGVMLCQSCYRLLTHGNEKLVPSEACADGESRMGRGVAHSYVREEKERAWYFK